MNSSHKRLEVVIKREPLTRGDGNAWWLNWPDKLALNNCLFQINSLYLVSQIVIVDDNVWVDAWLLTWGINCKWIAFVRPQTKDQRFLASARHLLLLKGDCWFSLSPSSTASLCNKRENLRQFIHLRLLDRKHDTKVWARHSSIYITLNTTFDVRVFSKFWR